VPFRIILLVPVFNEAENVIPITEAIGQAFRFVRNCHHEILFIDDGSTDETLEKLKYLESEKRNISYLSFSRNFGKDAALLAGFLHAEADAFITIDADMQHPPELIPDLIEQWQNGFEVVYTYREQKNKHASFFSQLLSRFFYFLISRLAEVKLENGLSDYKLVDKKVVAVIKDLKEGVPFFRGLFKWIGYKQKGLPYTTQARWKGHSKYSKTALFKLAVHSITSFSTKPLSLAIYIGFFASALSFLYIPYALFSLYRGWAISGWTSTIVTISFFGGIQLIVLGIIGLYLGKLFMQSKSRPPYLISELKIKNKIITGSPIYERNKKMDTFR
jgi:polyisoprenyl-phosphate glycosyltransferase